MKAKQELTFIQKGLQVDVRPANSTTLIQSQYRYRLSLSFAGFLPSRRSSAGEYLPTDTCASNERKMQADECRSRLVRFTRQAHRGQMQNFSFVYIIIVVITINYVKS